MQIPLFDRLEQFFSKRPNYYFSAFLSEEERKKLRTYCLAKSEKILQKSTSSNSLSFETEFFASMHQAEKLCLDHSPEVLRLTELYLLWAQFSEKSKGALFGLHLASLGLKNTQDPQIIMQLRYMSAKILSFLDGFFPEEDLIEPAIAHFEEVEPLFTQENKAISSLFYWDFAKAWYLSAIASEELSDLNKSLQLFEKAESLGCDLPLFHFDFGVLLTEIGVVKGDGASVKKALKHFESALPSIYLMTDDNPSDWASQELKEKLWIWLATASFILFNQTGSEENLNLADHYHREALLAVPTATSLWLLWGELFISHGWIYKNASSVEKAIEKLTSLKISDDPSPAASILLGEALMLLGLLFEDYNLLKLGEKRIIDGIDQSFDSGAKGMISMFYGLYYAEEHYFEEAYEAFQSALKEKNGRLSTMRHLLRTCLAWGIWSENSFILKKSAAVAERLCQKVPEMAYHWIGWGLSLLHLYKFERSEIAHLEEAIVNLKKGIFLSETQYDPDHWFFLGMALDMYGDEMGSEEDLEQAVLIFKTLLEQSPHAVNVRYHLALALSHLGEFVGDFGTIDQALLLFNEVVTPGEEDGSLWFHWGYALLLSLDLKTAFASLEEIEKLRSLAEEKFQVAIKRGFVGAYYHLACLYSIAGQKELALNALSEAEKRGMLPPLDQMNKDEWLEAIRDTKEYADFMNERNNKFKF